MAIIEPKHELVVLTTVKSVQKALLKSKRVSLDNAVNMARKGDPSGLIYREIDSAKRGLTCGDKKSIYCSYYIEDKKVKK